MNTFHPGMAAAHPGMPPGQHMGPVNPHQAGPPMGHMQGQGMHPQMHPQMPGHNPVSQAGQMMGGMPQGINPNPNAMAHLQTGPQIFPNQQMQQVNQQHILAQQQQQEQLARHKAALMNQRQQNPMGTMLQPGQGMSPQQLQQLQQQQHQLRMNIPNMPPNPQMMAQMMQAQHQAGGPGGAPQRQGGPPVGPGQQMRGPPHMQGMHPQQAGPNAQGGVGGPAPQMRPQTSNQGMQGPQGQNAQTQQGQQQPPQRPPMPGRQPTNHSSPQQPTPQNQQIPQSQPQQENPVTTSGPPSSTAGSQEGQNRGTQQQQQGQQQQPNPQANSEVQKQMMQNPTLQTQYRQGMAQRTAASQMAQVNELLTQGAKIRLVLFAEHISGINSEKNLTPPIESLQQMVSEYFVDTGTFRMRQPAQSASESEYSVPMATLARFFLTQYESGVQNIQLSVSRAQVSGESVPSIQQVFCDQAHFTYTFPNNQFIRIKGRLRALLNLQQHKFESLDFETAEQDEFMSSAAFRAKLSSNSPENQGKSPLMNKSKPPGKLKGGKNSQIRTATITEDDLPKIDLKDNTAFTKQAHHFLEWTTNFSLMQNLIDFAQQNKIPGSKEALQRYNEAHQSGQLSMPQAMMGTTVPGAQAAAGAAQQPPFSYMGMGPNGMPAGANFGGMRPQAASLNSQFPSPAGNHLGLPNAAMNSPHMRQGGSPGQPGMPPHMQGGPMAAQMSAQPSMQGTNSGAASSNASPNAPNKKRRASQVKLDGLMDPGGMPQMNGVTPNKPTPKMTNQTKRPRQG